MKYRPGFSKISDEECREIARDNGFALSDLQAIAGGSDEYDLNKNFTRFEAYQFREWCRRKVSSRESDEAEYAKGRRELHAEEAGRFY